MSRLKNAKNRWTGKEHSYDILQNVNDSWKHHGEMKVCARVKKLSKVGLTVWATLWLNIAAPYANKSKNCDRNCHNTFRYNFYNKFIIAHLITKNDINWTNLQGEG